jgi:hypothetical protein
MSFINNPVFLWMHISLAAPCWSAGIHEKDALFRGECQLEPIIQKKERTKKRFSSIHSKF